LPRLTIQRNQLKISYVKAFDRREEALVELEHEAKDEFGDTLLPPDDTGQEPSG